MFTINTQWALGKSGVMWGTNAPTESASITSEQKAAEQALKAIQDYQGNDNILLSRLLNSFHSANVDFAKKNNIESSKIDISLTAAIVAESNPEKKRILEELQKERTEKIKALDAKRAAEAIGVKTITAQGTAAAVPSKAPDISSTGAKKPKTTVVGQSEQATALGKILSVDAKTNPVIENLKDTNIPSLLAMVTTQPISKLEEYIKDWTNPERKVDVYTGLQNLGYSPNGGFGSTELSAVKNFIEYYLKSSPTDKDKIQQAANYTRAGLATTISQKSIEGRENIKDVDTVISYLTDLPDARFRADDIRKALQSRKGNEKAFIAMINRVTGGNAVDMTQLITDLKTKPELKARFYENINTAGANRSTTLGQFLDGKGAEKAKERADSVTKILNEKVTNTVTNLQQQAANTTDPTEKAKIDAILSEYNKKVDSWLTGEIRKVAEGAFVNIGKNANTVGAGMSFETFLKGLTVNLGAGISNGKVGPAAVIHYDIASGEITQTEKKIIEGSIGAGTSVFPAVIPFVDVGLKAIDKISVYGDGAGKIRSSGLNAMIANGGGSLSLAFLEERKSEIDQGTKLMNSVIDKFAALSAPVTDQKIKEIIALQKGMSITPVEATYWAGRMNELYGVNGVTDNTPSEAKAILIKGLVEVEGEKKHTQEAMNDVDGRSYKGFSVGVGHLFGVTFPLVGVYFKEGKIQYNYSDVPVQKKDSGAKVVQPVDAPVATVSSKGSKSQDPSDTIDALASRENIATGLGGSIYVMSRDKKTYPLFDSALLKISNGDYTGAQADLKKMKLSKTAQSLVASSKDDPSKLAIVNTFTYGGKHEKNKQALTDKDYATARSSTIKAENKLSPENPEAEAFFKEKTTHQSISIMERYVGQDIASSVFATPKGGSHRIDKYPGSVKVSDSIYTGTMLDSQKSRLITEHSASIDKNLKALNDQSSVKIEKDQYVKILQTGTIPQELVEKGFEFIKKPQFIEARAMILGNLCANRVEAIVFPQFKIPTIITIPGKPPQLQTIPQDIPTTSDFDPVGAGFLATEVTSGLLGGLYNNPENTAQTENKQKPDSKPTTDTNGEIKPPPGGSPVITPPQPATPVTIPEVITPVTPGANGPKIK